MTQCNCFIAVCRAPLTNGTYFGKTVVFGCPCRGRPLRLACRATPDPVSFGHVVMEGISMKLIHSAVSRPLIVTATAFVSVLGVSGLLASASTPGADTRLTNDNPASAGYVSNYNMNHPGAPVSKDATLTECSRSRGRQNEPSVAVDPRNTDVIVGSSNDYCGVYNDGLDTDGSPIPSGPIWLGYYRSENGGRSFQSSLVPGYPGDNTPYAARSQLRTASAGDPVTAWDLQGRLFRAPRRPTTQAAP